MEYSLLLLCSHAFHTARYLSIAPTFSKSLSQLESRFLSWLPSLLDLPLSVCFFLSFSSERLSHPSSPLLPAPAPYRIELSDPFGSLRSFFHPSCVDHITVSLFFRFFRPSLPLFVERSPIPSCHTHTSRPNLSPRRCSADPVDLFLVRRADGSKRSVDSDSFLSKTGKLSFESSSLTRSVGSFPSGIALRSH